MPGTAVLIYCTKCKQKTESKDTANTTTKNGRPATTGKCAVCDSKKYLLGKHVA